MTRDPAGGSIAYVDTAQMVEVDRAMIEDYRIELIQMMENAGRNLAHLARMRFAEYVEPSAQATPDTIAGSASEETSLTTGFR